MTFSILPPRMLRRGLPLVIAGATGLGLNSAATAAPSAHPARPAARAAGPARPAVAPVHVALAHAPRAAGARATPPLTPAALHAAYALPTRGAGHQVIAVISAYDDPAAQADLAAYNKHYGLPACTVANHCFRQLNGAGQATPQPAQDPTGGQWITESALGTQMAHAICQSCSIMLVQAGGAYKQQFAQAVNSAAAAGATVIATTFNLSESDIDNAYAGAFTHPRSAVVAAAGDGGYTGEVTFPASLPNVLAVGGTQLTLGSHSAYAGESAWSQTVTGCSSFQTAAPWQTQDAAAVNCSSLRAVADLSAMAQPGAVVHITGSGMSGGPWFVATGTSVAAPVVAGMIGLAGSAGSNEVPMLYARAKTDPGAFHDIVRGDNSLGCSSPICKAVKGYDAPTGLGTPFGLAAFLPNGGALNRRHPRLNVSLSGRRPKLARGWTERLNIANANAFAIHGTVTLRAQVGHRVVTLSPATALRLKPLGGGTLKVTILRSQRSALRSAGIAAVQAQVDLVGSAGGHVHFVRSLGRLLAP